MEKNIIISQNRIGQRRYIVEFMKIQDDDTVRSEGG